MGNFDNLTGTDEVHRALMIEICDHLDSQYCLRSFHKFKEYCKIKLPPAEASSSTPSEIFEHLEKRGLWGPHRYKDSDVRRWLEGTDARIAPLIDEAEKRVSYLNGLTQQRKTMCALQCTRHQTYTIPPRTTNNKALSAEVERHEEQLISSAENIQRQLDRKDATSMDLYETLEEVISRWPRKSDTQRKFENMGYPRENYPNSGPEIREAMDEIFRALMEFDKEAKENYKECKNELLEDYLGEKDYLTVAFRKRVCDELPPRLESSKNAEEIFGYLERKGVVNPCNLSYLRTNISGLDKRMDGLVQRAQEHLTKSMKRLIDQLQFAMKEWEKSMEAGSRDECCLMQRNATECPEPKKRRKIEC